MMENYQVLVIGAGPGGYVAAIRAAQLGLKTAIVERAELGGVCLNWGCLPTKTLLRSTEILRLAREGTPYGLVLDSAPRFDLTTAVKRSRDVAKQLNRGVHGLMKKNKVTVLSGHARLLGKGKVAIDNAGAEQEVQAKHIILATGARARAIPGFEPNSESIWTAREAMVPKTLPKSITVIGAGAIGVEFASFYATAGSQVTILEAADRILPVEDSEISGLLAEHLRKQGIEIYTGAYVENQETTTCGIKVNFTKGGSPLSVESEKVILAVGITGNVEGLGLENTKIQVDRTHIIVNEYCETDEPDIYAIGDIAGPPWLAHKASHEGVMVAELIAGVEDVHALDPKSVPSCTYCHPQVASVGITEEQALEQGFEVNIGRFPFLGNGKALSLGEPEGLVKTVIDKKTGELLGAHMIGPEVTELISTYALARTLETTEVELMQTVFPHPTLSEALHESVLSAYGKALHI
ncbi:MULTISPECIES: dihydrolipoyl dehydrogenase [unclassified Halomonas]|uniref:dihydrolipoyl dehydrogenase n=1 Tax=unclassified Halomonas TaxID=2609666 RepID=UPI00099049E5|nr:MULTISPECIES: dihydrolipoyl dehydrogenase [unclassified Halomonas]AQU84172.1 dihydrolipoyl dehydrogenase [Halomonas sp. 'Soap Lake \